MILYDVRARVDGFALGYKPGFAQGQSLYTRFLCSHKPASSFAVIGFAQVPVFVDGDYRGETTILAGRVTGNVEAAE
ncbi:hypothetical protein L3C95_19480 [Chitinophaga filiformis]|nr:hypothetical protein [Chitinophaga filiformis]